MSARPEEPPCTDREREAERTRASGATSARVSVGIATRGRPQHVRSVIAHLRRQTLAPDAVIVSCVGRDDIGGLEQADAVHVVLGRPGLARQRNAILDNLPEDTEIVVFFDDDFYPHDRWLEIAAAAFGADAKLACLTGNVIADGIGGSGLTTQAAVRALEAASPDDHLWVIDDYSPYGCNMAFRRAAIAGLRFDEKLVLYGWLEDRDFGARVSRARGRLIKLGAALGVHLGVKSGRVSGRRLGYSQVVNPYYMYRKRTMSARGAALQVLRNLSANVAKSLWPEPHIDRRGRLAGNLIGFGDLIVGSCNPERAEQL